LLNPLLAFFDFSKGKNAEGEDEFEEIKI